MKHDHRGGKRKAGKNPIYRLLLSHNQNRVCGVRETGHEYDRLKLEVSIRTAAFWKKRGLNDPGKLAFQ